MPDVIVVGDGPGGLSAALFLAKNGKDVVVFGEDKTAMHWALLHNYLGIPEMLGSEFQAVARKQVGDHGGTIRAERIDRIERAGDDFVAVTSSDSTIAARYLILSEGKSPRLARMLGLSHDETGGIQTDRNGHSSVDRVYVVGRLARPGTSQAIISAGDGAAAAVDILSREKGEPFCDWESPPEQS